MEKKTVKFFLIIFLFLALFSKEGIVLAEEKISATSAAIVLSEQVKDNRGERLEKYLQSHNSPLAPYSKFIINTADQYSLDWKLVPAISGLESSFGKRIPANSFNAYGWNSGRYYFEDWQDGIATVSKALKENYLDKWGAKTVEQIGPIYAESPTWSQRVAYFMNEIDNFQPSSLQLTL
ncbi:glucosaminidase domain-containing protein [Candidatus Microgenomates bacterium]|nr:glucosaminidase domain-containing protein [Candidatus Microgenomates bacterium]